MWPQTLWWKQRRHTHVCACTHTHREIFQILLKKTKWLKVLIPPVQTWAALHDRHTDKLAAIKRENQKHRWRQQTDYNSNWKINVVYVLWGTAIEKRCSRKNLSIPFERIISGSRWQHQFHSRLRPLEPSPIHQRYCLKEKRRQFPETKKQHCLCHCQWWMTGKKWQECQLQEKNLIKLSFFDFNYRHGHCFWLSLRLCLYNLSI